MLLIFATNDWFNDKEIWYDENNICRIQSQAQQYWCLHLCWLYAPHWLLGSWKNLKTTPCSDWALNALAIDEPLEYARLYLDGTVQMWVDAEDSFYLWWLSCHSQYLREWQFLYLFEYNLVFELLYGKIKRANTIIFSRNLDNALHLMVSMESWHRILGICKI